MEEHPGGQDTVGGPASWAVEGPASWVVGGHFLGGSVMGSFLQRHSHRVVELLE